MNASFSRNTNKSVSTDSWQILMVALVLFALGINALTAQNEKKYEDFDASNFDESSANITNPWMAMKPGSRAVMAGITVNDDGEVMDNRFVETVTGLTKKIAGVNCLVVMDKDYINGELAETELAYFAQDKKGNVWRMGEYPEEFEDGEFADSPAWFCGIQDAVAGISMLANPWEGTPSYSQGWGPKIGFTDRGQVSKMGEKICVPMDCYENVLVIGETAEDEPGLVSYKLWVEGVGNVQSGYEAKKGEEPKEFLKLVDMMEFDGEALKAINEEAMRLEKIGYDRRGASKVIGKTEPSKPLSDIK